MALAVSLTSKFLPITQQEGLPLTFGQRPHRLLDDRHHLRLLEAVGGGGRDVGAGPRPRRFRAGRASSSSPAEAQRGPERRPRGAHLAAPEVVANAVLQDALEEERQFLRRAGPRTSPRASASRPGRCRAPTRRPGPRTRTA